MVKLYVAALVAAVAQAEWDNTESDCNAFISSHFPSVTCTEPSTDFSTFSGVSITCSGTDNKCIGGSSE